MHIWMEVPTGKYRSTKAFLSAGEMSGTHIRKFCTLEREAEEFLREVYQQMGLSVRMHDKILKVARTAADLEERDRISYGNLCEAVSYVRAKEQFWKG